MVMNEDVVSVIVPIYNAMPYFKECLASICNQTYKNIEIVLVDDGSTDESGRYCDKIASLDKRVRVFHKANRELVLARQFGIEKATGKYFVFVDSDDMVDLDLVDKLSAEIKERQSDIILFGLVEESGSTRVYKNNYFAEGYYDKKRIENEVLPEMITGNNFFSFHILPNFVCKCVKKKWYNACFKKVSANVKYGEDADLTYQIIPQAKSLSIIDFYPYHYIKHEESMVSGYVEEAEIISLENDIKDTLSKIDMYELLANQILRYFCFVRMVKRPETVMDIDVLKRHDIALYGAGATGQSIKRILDNSIKIWVDKNYSEYKKRNMDVHPIEVLEKYNNRYELVLIAITNEAICQDIAKKLKKDGIKKPIIYVKYSGGKLIIQELLV